MKISDKTIEALSQTVTGDNDKSFYRTGPELVEFFNELGFDDQYHQGFPTRVYYAEGKIRTLNGTEHLARLFDLLLDPRLYIESEYQREEVVEYLNQYLKFDGYELEEYSGYYKIRDLDGSLIGLETNKAFPGSSNEFIKEQLEKCEKKIAEEDYDGVITNARSLIETVFKDVVEDATGKRPENKNLNNLYTSVYNILNLDPSRKDINNSLREMLNGLISVVNGMASLRNRMSDAHSRKYKPDRHHALLAANCANTTVNFIFDTYKYQKDRGFL